MRGGGGAILFGLGPEERTTSCFKVGNTLTMVLLFLTYGTGFVVVVVVVVSGSFLVGIV